MPLNVFFDVDYTIQGDDGSLRPGVREVFERLVGDGHIIYVWSALGERWDDLRRHGLLDLVSGVYRKPLYDHRARLPELGITAEPHFVVDDSPDIVEAFVGAVIEAFSGDATDREMHRIYDLVAAAAAAAADGLTDETASRPPVIDMSGWVPGP